MSVEYNRGVCDANQALRAGKLARLDGKSIGTNPYNSHQQYELWCLFDEGWGCLRNGRRFVEMESQPKTPDDSAARHYQEAHEAWSAGRKAFMDDKSLAGLAGDAVFRAARMTQDLQTRIEALNVDAMVLATLLDKMANAQ